RSSAVLLRQCIRRICVAASMTTVVGLAGPTGLRAQGRVGPDSATRLTRLGRDIAFGTAMAAVFSAKDQLANDPSQWGNGWSGYGRRFASNAGEFVIQESVTDGLAAI